jgi:hypothetical protein
MLRRDHLTPGLLYSLSPDSIIQMHLEIVMATNMDNEAGLYVTEIRESFMDYFIAFLKKIC